MEIKVDTLIKELERHKGKVITKIQISDRNLNIELECISNIIANTRYIVDEQDYSNNEVLLFLDAR